MNILGYYSQLHQCYISDKSTESDKAKSMRTIFEKFMQEYTQSCGSLNSTLERFYQQHKDKTIRNVTSVLRVRLNNIVHQNLTITKQELHDIYSIIVRIIFIATNEMPEHETLVDIGIRTEQHFEHLNDQQKAAVLNDSKIIYVNAGPGTGKTTLLAHKIIQYILTSQEREKIVALSYTNSAADELGNKIYKTLLENHTTNDYSICHCTIHSFCFKCLKTYYDSYKPEENFNYIILDDSDIDELADEIYLQAEGKYNITLIKKCIKEGDRTQNDELKRLIHTIKSQYKIISINEILTLYLETLKEDTVFRKWMNENLSVLLVDEAQDLSSLNYKIINELIETIPNLRVFLVGDPRQNIFTFIGGSYKHLNNFLEQYKSDITELPLTISYRCPQTVLDYVNQMLFTDCQNLTLTSHNPQNKGNIFLQSYHDNQTEARAIVEKIKTINNYSQTAVLCNSLKYLTSVAQYLNQENIPFKVFGGTRMVNHHIKIFNHLLRYISTNNKYSHKKLHDNLNLKSEESQNSFENKIAEIKNTLNEFPYNLALTFKSCIEFLLSNEYSNCLLIDATLEEVMDDYELITRLCEEYSTIDEYLLEFAIDREKFSPFYKRDLDIDCVVENPDQYVTISTIHSAKGLEWENVIIAGLSEGLFPNPYFCEKDNLEETEENYNNELKKMYVAATRTLKDLHITYPVVKTVVKGNNTYTFNLAPSRFLIYLNT